MARPRTPSGASHGPAAADPLDGILPVLVRVATRPGAVLVTTSALGTGLLALVAALGLWAGRTAPAVVGLVVAALAGSFTLVLHGRRRRLTTALDSMGGVTVVPASGELVRHHPGGAGQYDSGVTGALGSVARGLERAGEEYAIRPARFLPRVEAAQRAALAALGGPVRAPYLRDDLRVTLVALVGTAAMVPVVAVVTMALFVALLLGS